MKQTVLTIVLMGMLLPRSSLAGVIPGRWEKVATLEIGNGIIITLRSGERIEGSYAGLFPDSLEIRENTGRLRTLPRPEVLTITTSEKVPDSKLNGALIGAGIGFGVGFFSLAAFNARATASGPIWDAEALGYYAGAGLAMAAAGAVVGAVIDAAHKERQLLYRAR